MPASMHSNDREALFRMTDDSESTFIQSSPDLNPNRLDDNAFAVHANIESAALSSNDPYPVATQIPTEPSSTISQSLTHVKQGSKERLVQPLSGGYSKWKASWRLQTTVVGLFLLGGYNIDLLNRPAFVLILLTITALIHAAVHCGFFFYLDGRVLSNDPELSIQKTTIPQGYVTTISFLLATAFRAALVASVGVCYTQYLWATLRERILKVLFTTCSPLFPL